MGKFDSSSLLYRQYLSRPSGMRVGQAISPSPNSQGEMSPSNSPKNMTLGSLAPRINSQTTTTAAASNVIFSHNAASSVSNKRPDHSKSLNKMRPRLVVGKGNILMKRPCVQRIGQKVKQQADQGVQHESHHGSTSFISPKSITSPVSYAMNPLLANNVLL